MIYCPQCGSSLKSSSNTDPKFCKYCGYKLKPLNPSGSNSTSSTGSISPSSSSLYSKSIYPENESPDLRAGEVSADSPPIGEPLDEPDSYANLNEEESVSTVLTEEPEFPSISADMIDVLAGRLEVQTIKDKMSAILEEISKIEQRLDIGLLSAPDAKEQIEQKQKEINQLRDSRNNIPIEELPIEGFHKKVLEMKDKLLKLEEMKKEGKITRESVYQKLFTEYNDEYLRNKEKFDEETRRLKQWQQQLIEDVKNYHDHAELALTRAEMGEISAEQSLKEKENYEKEADKRELASSVIKEVLETIKG